MVALRLILISETRALCRAHRLDANFPMDSSRAAVNPANAISWAGSLGDDGFGTGWRRRAGDLDGY